MFCVGGTRGLKTVPEEEELNYQGQLINEGQSEIQGQGRTDQRLLSPLRSLTLSPIPHTGAGMNSNLEHLDIHGLQTESVTGNMDTYQTSHKGMGTLRGGTLERIATQRGDNLSQGYHQRLGHTSNQEDIYGSLPHGYSRSETHTYSKEAYTYGTLPRVRHSSRDKDRHAPRRSSSFQQLSKASTSVSRSHSCRVTNSEMGPAHVKYRTQAILEKKYDENFDKDGFRKPPVPSSGGLKNRDVNVPKEEKVKSDSKKIAFSVRTAIKRKLASLKGKGRFNSYSYKCYM